MALFSGQAPRGQEGPRVEGEGLGHHVAVAVAQHDRSGRAGPGHALGEGFNRVYTRHFLATLRAKALAKCERHPGHFDAARIAGARSLAEFDDAYTAPAHGFAGVEDYWRRASARPWLGGIEVPTLVLNAANDPFVPARALPDVRTLPSAVHFDCPDEGGHVGFLAGAWPGNQDWLAKRVLAHFDRAR